MLSLGARSKTGCILCVSCANATRLEAIALRLEVRVHSEVHTVKVHSGRSHTSSVQISVHKDLFPCCGKGHRKYLGTGFKPKPLSWF